MVQIENEDPRSETASRIIDELSDALTLITGDSGRSSFDANDVSGKRACFVVARQTDGQVVGCGAIRPLESGVAELKRMFARTGTRGIGEALLAHLESSAADFGFESVRLSTRAVNTRAVAFYKKHGYATIPNFGKYAGRNESVCMEKFLVRPNK
jgi:ribosomal protein S18 acetylase RimI-like enzyme